MTIIVILFSFLSVFDINSGIIQKIKEEDDYHKFYMSRTEINHNESNKSLEITVQIFTDDFEYSLENSTKNKIRLGTSKEHIGTDKFIEKYFKNNFSVSINGSPKSYSYLGKEVEIHKTYCYFEITNIDDFSTITIKNTILLDYFKDQKNIIVSTKGRQKKSILLQNANKEGTIKY